jgi:hypothetical protein
MLWIVDIGCGVTMRLTEMFDGGLVEAGYADPRVSTYLTTAQVAMSQ